MATPENLTPFEYFFYNGGRVPLYMFESEQLGIAAWPDGVPKLDLQAVVASRDRYPGSMTEFSELPFVLRQSMHAVADMMAHKGVSAIRRMMRDRNLELPIHYHRDVPVKNEPLFKGHQLHSGFNVNHPHIVVAPAEQGFFKNMWDHTKLPDTVLSAAMEQTIAYMRLSNEETRILDEQLHAIGSISLAPEFELPRL